MRDYKEKGRLVFKFYKSYFDVFNNLQNDKDKLDFITAILNKQFHNIEPTKITKMAMFAYSSQKHSIDSQIEGFESKTGLKLNEINPTQGGAQGGIEPPTLETQSESQPKPETESQIDKFDFNSFWILYDKKVGVKEVLEKKWNLLSENEKKQIFEYVPKYKISQPDKKFRKDPSTFLNQKAWNNELIGLPKQIVKEEGNTW